VIDWAVATAALEGEEESGDLHVVRSFHGGALVAVIDGLGHGPEAAVAARHAAAVLDSHYAETVVGLLQRCHQTLRGTRGAVITLASFRTAGPAMSWAGVGNIEGTLLRRDPGERRPRESVMLVGGVPGHKLPPLRASDLPIAAGDTLVLSTDGIRAGYMDTVAPHHTPQQIADRLLADYGKGTDDALVLVARYLGASG
jgi:phosphoserine phosphatase RsbX